MRQSTFMALLGSVAMLAPLTANITPAQAESMNAAPPVQVAFIGRVIDRVIDEAIDTIPMEIDATIDFRNETDQSILVVMNSQESHLIAPGGQATFSKANVGDSPTFYVKTPDTGEVLFSRKVHNLGVKSSFGFNGIGF